MPSAPRGPFDVGKLLEIPITTLDVAGRTFPCGGGGFFRLYPYPVTRWSLRQVNERDGRAAVFYMHPWEFDPEQPRVPGVSLKTRIRHYLNLARTEARFRRLCADFAWGRMDDVFAVN